MQRFVLSLPLLLIVAVWGWTFVIVKDAVADFGVLPFLAIRFTIGLGCLLPMLLRERLNRHDLLVGGGIGIALAAAYLLQTLGLDASTATNTGLITGLCVVFAPLANRVLFGVRTAVAVWVAIAISFAGLVLLTGAAPDGIYPGDVFTLGCAIAFGLHIALLDRHSSRKKTRELVLGQIGVAALFFWAATWISGAHVMQPTPDIWFALLITGIIATAGGFYVQTLAQRRLSATEVALIILLEPVFAGIFGALFHHDRLNLLQGFGALLMLGALFAVEMRRRGR